jgi:hypothetical protein
VSFARACFEFVIGDDWRAAVAIVAAVALTAVLAHANVSAWWLLPPAVVIIVYASLRRATR